MRRAALAAALAAALGGCRAGFYAHFVPYYLAGAKPKTECGRGPGFDYCVHGAPNGRDDDEAALYFLHYAGGSERTWSRMPVSRVYYAEFAKRGLPAPRVISVSYGPYWMLFDKPGPKSPEGLFPAFVERAMPWLEGKLPRKPARRYLWGMSQGGLNGAELLLRRPDLWAGAALSCPAWYTIDVFASSQTVAGYTSRNRADRGTVDWGLSLIRERVAGPREWAQEDPLARAVAAPALPPVYIDCTPGDQFGFYEGARLMERRLREAGRRVAFHEESGRHCQLDARAAAAFLAETAQRPPEAIDAGPAAIK